MDTVSAVRTLVSSHFRYPYSPDSETTVRPSGKGAAAHNPLRVLIKSVLSTYGPEPMAAIRHRELLLCFTV